MIGIMAYGSLISDPGIEIQNRLDRSISDVETPFPVEYARRSGSRNGAPTLVPVPPGRAGFVKGVVLVMKKYSHKDAIQNYLYRRELHAVGNKTKVYDHGIQSRRREAMLIESLPGFQDLELVYNTRFPINFGEILDPNRDIQEKAMLLARAARVSLSSETYLNRLDGIQYLLNNIDNSIITQLVISYMQAILDLADNALNLADARLLIARQKGIIP